MKTTVLIADDHSIVRRGLRALIQSDAGLELTGEAGNGQEALDLARRLKPDILVLDLSMPGMDGIQVTRAVKAELPGTRVLILTVHEDVSLLRGAIKAGASGYIIKHAAESELIAAIRAVLRGETYVYPALIPAILQEAVPSNPQPDSPADALTPRETEVLKLLVQGFTNRQIAAELDLSTRTVEGHRANITEKLGLHSRVELVRYARGRGLLEEP